MSNFRDKIAAQRSSRPEASKIEDTFQRASDDRARFTLRLPAETYEELQRIALENRTKVNPILMAAAERIVRDYKQSGRLDP